MTTAHADPELKLIRFTGQPSVTDDPSFPYKLEVNLRPPDFMNVAFVMLYGGSEELVVRALSRAAVDRFVEANHLRSHVRLRWLKITAPDGTVEELKR